MTTETCERCGQPWIRFRGGPLARVPGKKRRIRLIEEKPNCPHCGWYAPNRRAEEGK